MSTSPMQCLLCGGPPPLVEGHLIPDFAVRRLKKDGPSGFLRGENPNRRIQGSVKEPLLCADCDNRRFSDAETSFANRIFHPFLDDRANEFDCTETDRYFVASLAWRATVSRLRTRTTGDFDYLPDEVAAMKEAAGRLRLYLLGAQQYPEEVEQHIFFCGPDGHGQFLGLIIGRHDRLYTLAILSGVVIASPLRIPADSLGDWRYDTLLIPGERIHAGGQTIADRIFGGILAARADALYKLRDQMSERQRAKLRDAFRAVDWVRVAASRQGRALIRDRLNREARDGG